MLVHCQTLKICSRIDYVINEETDEKCYLDIHLREAGVDALNAHDAH